MKTIRDLRALVESAGGILEEDASCNGMRILQAVAPEGQVWRGDDLHALVIYWPIPCQWSDGRLEAYADAVSRLSHGLRAMTVAEADLYAVD